MQSKLDSARYLKKKQGQALKAGRLCPLQSTLF